jgi:glycosyltransferase involved in cell wall biosynthesis
MENRITVSVVIAVYNGEKYIAETLDSLISQTLTTWECWIVDDGSTDLTVSIVQRYCAKDIRFHLIETKGGNGPYFAANLAFPSCQGELIARIDADDICMPTRLEVQSAYLHEHPKVNVCSSQCYTMDVRGPFERYDDIPDDFNLLRWQLLFHNRLVHSTMMMRSAWFERIGYYPNKELSQDYLIWCKAMITGSFGLCRERLVVWRQHKNSITSSNREDQFNSTLKVANDYAAEILGEVDLLFYKNLMADAWGHKLGDGHEIEQTLDYFNELYSTYEKKYGESKNVRKDFRKRYFLILRRNMSGARSEAIKAILNFVRFDILVVFSRDFNATIFRLIFS